MDCFLLGGIKLEWDDGGLALLPGPYLEKFRCSFVENDAPVRFQGSFVPLQAYTRYPLITENSVYAMFDVEGEPLLVYHWGYRRFAFAIWPDRIDAEKINTCLFDPDMRSQPRLSADWFFGVSGLHKALLQRNAAILHASYIDWNGQAVLFTAPSGTGKSTQAQLWAKYSGAEIVNGDRVLVRQWNGHWHAFGYPCCGSSKICLNRTLPLRVIVVLRQGTENNVEQLTVLQKVRALAAATEVYPWDGPEINRALDLASLLVQDMPVLQLTCTPDEGAVYTLKQYLEGPYAADI